MVGMFKYYLKYAYTNYLTLYKLSLFKTVFASDSDFHSPPPSPKFTQGMLVIASADMRKSGPRIAGLGSVTLMKLVLYEYTPVQRQISFVRPNSQFQVSTDVVQTVQRLPAVSAELACIVTVKTFTSPAGSHNRYSYRSGLQHVTKTTRYFSQTSARTFGTF
jgi:hypothetical protein